MTIQKIPEFVRTIARPSTIREVGSKAGEPNEAGENTAALKERIDDLTRRVTDLQNGGTLQERVDRLAERVARLREPAEHKLAEDTRTTEQFAAAVSPDYSDPDAVKRFARSVAG
ncbi:MAG TPA: hypothetical protein VM243_06345 [Phycisphaerae bacterium]|nr:hypothetical protein [Phycisphaerae bacterium]